MDFETLFWSVRAVSLLGGPYTIKIDNTAILEGYSPPTNRTHAYIYFKYNHSTHTIEITGKTVIPEFPAFILLLLFMALSPY